ncbi:MAG: hypothetical protein JWM71_2420 [Solirubrobacteraceae bacterium]|nr:hypothetical protein [Solirubrobacteraceae bacterium]
MNDPDTAETTAGGLVGKLAGKAKAAAGSLIGNEDLAREGRLQEASSEAELVARREAAEARVQSDQARVVEEKAQTDEERRRLEAEVAAEEAEARAERDRLEAERRAEEQARQEREAAEAQRRTQELGADAIERQGERERLADAATAVTLEQEARRAEARADAIDPEE